MTGKLRIDHLTKEFVSTAGEHVIALQDIDLEVRDEEIICLLGPSGCGKTTLLRIIGGLDYATSGSAFLNGVLIDGPDPKTAMIFQEYSLFPWRDVMGNIVLGLEIQGAPRDSRIAAARQYLELVGLQGFERSYPYELSGGMRQRVAVARALAVDPEILLMDEPFGALDAQTRNRMQLELLHIWEKTRKTVIFVTHSVDEAVFLADRVVVLTRRPGRIKEIIEVPQKRPRERTAQAFIEIRRHVLDLIAEESPASSKV
ncbi:MAG: ABC transporter ATP-binding protein [Methanomicrobiales archaeon]|nr:ABC transporter ATP-binding protein [Methanomicrobiales archaeon]